MFVLSFKNGSNDPTRDVFDKYYMPLVKIKDFSALIDSKLFFWSASKKQTISVWKTYWNAKNGGYTTGNLLDFSYDQNYYKLIGTYLSRQTDVNIIQQINFTEKLEMMVQQCLLLLKSNKKNYRFLIVTE